MSPTTSRSQAARAPAKHFDVAGMQEIENAVGKADTQILCAPLGQWLIKLAPVEYDFFLRRQRRSRQDTRAQFRGGNGSGPALADDHGRRGIRRAHCRLKVRADRQHQREYRNDRVAGARNIAYLHRISRHVNGLCGARVEQHAFLTHRHQHSLAVGGARKLGGSRGKISLGLDRPPRRIDEFLAVWRNDGRTTVDREVRALRIDHDRLLELSCFLDHRTYEARRKQPLGVVRQHNCVDSPHSRMRLLDQCRLDFRVNRLCQFPIRAQEMRGVVLGDETAVCASSAAKHRPQDAV